MAEPDSDPSFASERGGDSLCSGPVEKFEHRPLAGTVFELDGCEEGGEEEVPQFYVHALEQGRLAAEKKKKPKKKKKHRMVINLRSCKYDIVRVCAKQCGWKVDYDDGDDWDLMWSDAELKGIRVNRLQKYNHLTGSFEIARKDRLAQNIKRMQNSFGHEFEFIPPTFILPKEFESMKAWHHSLPKKKKGWLIVKPDNGRQGKGIFLTNDLDKLDKEEHCVAQEYAGPSRTHVNLCTDMRTDVCTGGAGAGTCPAR